MTMTRNAPSGGGRQTLNGVCCVAPLLLALMALTLVLQGVIQYDGAIPAGEGAGARLFQILVALQIPLIALFAVTADWSARTRTLRLLGLQLAGWLSAIAAAGLWEWTAA